MNLRTSKKSAHSEGYVCIKSKARYQTWVDKYIVVTAKAVKILYSRKLAKTEQAFPLSALRGTSEVSSRELHLAFANGDVLQLWSASPTYAKAWHALLKPHVRAGSIAELDVSATTSSSIRMSVTATATAPSSAEPSRSRLSTSTQRQLDQSREPSKSKSTQQRPSKSGLSPTSSASSSDVEDDMPETSSDATWEGALVSFARKLAELTVKRMQPMDEKAASTGTVLAATQGQESKQQTPSSSSESKSSSSSSDSSHTQKIKAIVEFVSNGAILKKYKRNKCSKRTIWCTELLDHLCWGDIDKFTVKGFLRVAEITDITQGFGKNKFRFYVTTKDRTLELEGKSSDETNEWKNALHLLMQLNAIKRSEVKKLLEAPAVKKVQKLTRMSHCDLLKVGDIFKKWPGKKKIMKGTFTNRKLWCPKELNKLHWGDIQTHKIKGSLGFEDLIAVVEDRESALKLTVLSKGRSLDLEAKSVLIRERFARALRFVIHFKDTFT
jgi:hypothetical protein